MKFFSQKVEKSFREKIEVKNEENMRRIKCDIYRKLEENL